MIDFRRQLQAIWQGLPEPGLLRWSSLFFLLFAFSILLSVAASQIFFTCAGILYAIDLVRRPRVPRFPPIKLPLILFCLFTTLSIFWAENPDVGWTAVRKLTLFLIVLLAVNLIATHRQLLLILRVLFAESALAGIVAVVQFVLQYREVRTEHPGQFYYYMTLMRIHGFMGHWMTFGGQQMMVFIVLTAFLLGTNRNAVSRSYGTAALKAEPDALQGTRGAGERPKFRLLWWGTLGIILFSLLLNFTRGVWLGCGVALLYLVARWRPRLLWVLPAGALLIYIAAPSLLRERLMTMIHPSTDPAITVRFEMWHVGLAMIHRHPLIGVGPNNVNEVYLAYLPRGVVPVAAWHEHLHDVYLQFAAERGLPCFIAWLWLMLLWGWSIFRIRRRLAKEDFASVWIADGSIAAWLAFMTEGWFEFNFGTTPVLMVLLLILSLPFALSKPERVI